MQIGLSIAMRKPGGFTLTQRAQAIMRSFGTNASSYPFATLQGAYQTSTGPAAAAAAVTDPVGMMLDGMGTVGSELIGNTTFDTDTWWSKNATVTISGGFAVWTASPDGYALYKTSLGVAGKTYKVVLDIASISEGALRIDISTGSGPSSAGPFTTPGTYTVWVVADNTTLYITTSGASTTATVNSISVREVTGNHATQTTAGNRPLLAQDGNGRFYASFDGSNDRLALTSVPFQMADDFAVVAAAKHGTPAAWSTMFSLSSAGTVPRIQLAMDGITGVALAYLRDDAASFVKIEGAVNLRNASAVFCLAKRGTAIYLRVNGVEVATASVAGLGVMTLTASSIGALATAADRMNGAIYDTILIKGTVTDAQLLVLEKAAAQRAGLVI